MHEMIQNTLMTLIHAVIVTAVPILTGLAVTYFKARIKHTQTQTDTHLSEHCLDELEDAVWAAVAQTSQAYVDSLKQSGTFSPEAQAVALDKAKVTALAALTPATQTFLKEAYGNLQSLLEAKIEAAVRAQKKE